jgi:hypothetical protein
MTESQAFITLSCRHFSNALTPWIYAKDGIEHAVCANRIDALAIAIHRFSSAFKPNRITALQLGIAYEATS